MIVEVVAVGLALAANVLAYHTYKVTGTAVQKKRLAETPAASEEVKPLEIEIPKKTREAPDQIEEEPVAVQKGEQAFIGQRQTALPQEELDKGILNLSSEVSKTGSALEELDWEEADATDLEKKIKGIDELMEELGEFRKLLLRLKAEKKGSKKK